MPIENAQLGRSERIRPRRSVKRNRRRNTGFTFAELIVVIVIISLFVLLTQMHLLGLLRRSTVRAQMQEFVSAMRMAATAAAESNKRYEVIVDLNEQRFLLRQITTTDLSEVLDEEIITENDFGTTCRVLYVEFDDGDATREGRAKFRAGRAGWQYGGRIGLMDEKEQPYTVLINRLNRTVEFYEGEVELLKPRQAEDLPW